jgi:RNA polymerase sigma-70 factor (ECF subfamily)
MAPSADDARPKGAADSDPDDLELVRRSLDGDQHAFRLLVGRHERKVFNLAYRMLGRAEDARDATQEAFLACYRNLPKFRGDAAFGTWLHRIAVNACYDHLRRRVPAPMDLTTLPDAPIGPDPADRAADTVDVQRALSSLPVEYRAVLILHDVQGRPYEEVAFALEIPLGTVKSRLHRARAALGRALAGTEASEADAPEDPTREPSGSPASSNPPNP